MVDYRLIQALRCYVKETARIEKRHPNAIWARLRKKYGFQSYKKIDCFLLKRIAADLNLKPVKITLIYKKSGFSGLKGIMTS